MPKRTDIRKVLVIGSGPIVIGQAAEFDYAGTQACLALKEEGYEVILCNSNPATIMTDTSIADKVYMEPLTLEYIAKIIRYERPDAILPGIGGQTGLNLAMQLEKKGVLAECRVELLGTRSSSIEQAEDREKFTSQMDNDLNTSRGVTMLYDVLKAKTNDRTKLALIEDFDRVLCLDLIGHAEAVRRREEEQKAAEAKALAEAAAADPFVAEILQLIEERKAAKKAKNFAEADRIRDYLASKGVTLVDTAQGTTYKMD